MFELIEPMSAWPVYIKDADMSGKMQQEAMHCASQAFERYDKEKNIAAYIKREFDQKFGPTWHCIVGRDFGSHVSPETKHFIYLYIRRVTILLFRIGTGASFSNHDIARFFGNGGIPPPIPPANF